MGKSIDKSDELRGIIPRICNSIYEKIGAAGSEMEFDIKVSFVEIYREKIRDLLNPAKDNLQIR